MRVTASQFQELLSQAPDKVAFLRMAENDRLEVLPDMTMREALYHHTKGRKFRQTRTEQATGQSSCPYCTSPLTKVRLRHNEHGFTCPRCRWSIHQDDVFDPTKDQIPQVREPGDATGPEMQQQNDAEPIDISMEEALDPMPIPVT